MSRMAPCTMWGTTILSCMRWHRQGRRASTRWLRRNSWRGTLSLCDGMAISSRRLTGCVRPLTNTCMGADADTSPQQRWYVESLMSTWPRRLSASMREARFTASPITVYSEYTSDPKRPAITVPVFTPMPRNTSGRRSVRWARFSSRMAICISTAHSSARSTSSSRATGAPNSTMIESPMNLSMVPWYLNTTSDNRARQRLSAAMTADAGCEPDSAVNPRRSASRMVTSRGATSRPLAAALSGFSMPCRMSAISACAASPSGLPVSRSISACRRRTASWWNSLCMEVWGVERPSFCGWG